MLSDKLTGSRKTPKENDVCAENYTARSAASVPNILWHCARNWKFFSNACPPFQVRTPY